MRGGPYRGFSLGEKPRRDEVARRPDGGCQIVIEVDDGPLARA
jgi:hypothetical protein